MNLRHHPSLIDALEPVTGRGWALVMVAVVAAFALLSILPWATPPLNFVPTLLFAGLPLAAYIAVNPARPPTILRAVGPRSIAIAVGFALLTIFCSFLAGLALSQVMLLASNSIVTSLADETATDLIVLLARSAIQLVGEELVTILPLLAILWLCTRRLGLSPRAATIVAVVLSTAWFAALHLPTYDWNVAQCFGTIGVARLVLTAAFLITRSLWVSSIAHILNDWSLFLFVYIGGHSPIEAGA